MTYRITNGSGMYLGVQKYEADGKTVYDLSNRKSNENLLFHSEEQAQDYLNMAVPGTSKQFTAKDLKSFTVVQDEPEPEAA